MLEDASRELIQLQGVSGRPLRSTAFTVTLLGRCSKDSRMRTQKNTEVRHLASMLAVCWEHMRAPEE